MSQPQTISPTRPGWHELRAVAAIQTASFRKDLAYKWWMLAIFWRFPGVTFLVTRDGEIVTGGIIADMHRGNIRIMNIAVHPGYRRQGIGKVLMMAALDAKPYDSAVLMVQEENKAAQALYTELGFRRSGFNASYYGAGHAGIEMRLSRD
ncbi:MAG: GNAT family N-acetyltransferase [Thermomicrobiales bacterium]|nr:GNAT family N-acetyltransferase [Thermomicrobiales bacterium]